MEDGSRGIVGWRAGMMIIQSSEKVEVSFPISYCVAGSQQPSFIAATLRGRGSKYGSEWIGLFFSFALVGLFFVLGKGCFTGRDVFRHEKGGTCRLVRGIHGCSKKRSAAAMAMI